MPSTPDLERPPNGVRFVPILLVNLVPLVGVIQFGWKPATLVAVYGLEVFLSFPLAGVKALFAQRPPRTDGDGMFSVSNANLTKKRGNVELASWLPPLHLRSVPFTMTVLGGSIGYVVLLWLILFEGTPVEKALARPGVVIGVVSLVTGQVVEIGRDNFYDGRYETVSPYTVIEMPARQAFFLCIFLFVPRPKGESVVIVLGAFVLVKLLIEWSFGPVTEEAGGSLAGSPVLTDQSSRPNHHAYPRENQTPGSEPIRPRSCTPQCSIRSRKHYLKRSKGS
ncbi:DUF6498-containing protein [Halogeometricum borinquense]|uniref:DUF6498-containing protein n=1 Tax=Halogeometricum borinquense TaxID=60847 RepID=UPI00343EAEC9